MVEKTDTHKSLIIKMKNEIEKLDASTNKFILLKDFIVNNEISKAKFTKLFPNDRGIYALWLIQDLDTQLNLDVQFKGPRNKENIYISSNYSKIEKPFKYQCLYIGKTTNFKNRISMHLMLGTKDWYSGKTATNSILKRNTQCQFRAGFEHILKNSKCSDNRELMINSVGLSFVPKESFEDRFFLENLAIGYYKPWFNLDSER